MTYGTISTLYSRNASRLPYMRKLATCSLLITVLNCEAGTNQFYYIPDKTPGITSTNWSYPDSPGDYFWNGLRTALVIGLTSVVIGAFIRKVG